MTGQKIKASTHFLERRWLRNQQEAARLREEGYTVERYDHPNGAYFAFIGNHQEHEKTVGRIFAENGFSFTLDREGNRKMRFPNGRRFILPSCDGHIEGLTHEIYTFNGKPNPQTVAYGIKHSYKPFVLDIKHSVQADVSITFSPKGNEYDEHVITEGVREYQRQLKKGETKATPLLCLHVIETERTIYWWRIKKEV